MNHGMVEQKEKVVDGCQHKGATRSLRPPPANRVGRPCWVDVAVANVSRVEGHDCAPNELRHKNAAGRMEPLAADHAQCQRVVGDEQIHVRVRAETKLVETVLPVAADEVRHASVVKAVQELDHTRPHAIFTSSNGCKLCRSGHYLREAAWEAGRVVRARWVPGAMHGRRRLPHAHTPRANARFIHVDAQRAQVALHLGSIVSCMYRDTTSLSHMHLEGIARAQQSQEEDDKRLTTPWIFRNPVASWHIRSVEFCELCSAERRIPERQVHGPTNDRAVKALQGLVVPGRTSRGTWVPKHQQVQLRTRRRRQHTDMHALLPVPSLQLWSGPARVAVRLKPSMRESHRRQPIQN
eukprot:scaffold58341_cov69-Phaeocystis_antarctica.AAC.1